MSVIPAKPSVPGPTRKPAGNGSITRVSSGFWVRIRAAGKRLSVGIYPTEQEAEQARLAALQKLARPASTTPGGTTLRDWAAAG